jgi:hypothetical protein
VRAGLRREDDYTAPDRVISTVDPEARHGHKTAAHGFDGYNRVLHKAVSLGLTLKLVAQRTRSAVMIWLPGLCRAGLEPERGWQQPRIPWSRNERRNDQETVTEDPAANHAAGE